MGLAFIIQYRATHIHLYSVLLQFINFYCYQVFHNLNISSYQRILTFFFAVTSSAVTNSSCARISFGHILRSGIAKAQVMQIFNLGSWFYFVIYLSFICAAYKMLYVIITLFSIFSHHCAFSMTLISNSCSIFFPHNLNQEFNLCNLLFRTSCCFILCFQCFLL